MKNIIISCLLGLLASCSNQSIDSETAPAQVRGAVLDMGDQLSFYSSQHKGVIYAPSSNKRIIELDSRIYEISVNSRTTPLGGRGDVKPRYGVYNPGESFYPHTGVQIVYDESIQDYKSEKLALNDLKSGLENKEGAKRYLLTNGGLYLRISGSHDSGRLSIGVKRMLANGKPIKLSSYVSRGSITLTKQKERHR